MSYRWDSDWELERKEREFGRNRWDDDDARREYYAVQREIEYREEQRREERRAEEAAERRREERRREEQQREEQEEWEMYERLREEELRASQGDYGPDPEGPDQGRAEEVPGAGGQETNGAQAPVLNKESV